MPCQCLIGTLLYFDLDECLPAVPFQLVYAAGSLTQNPSFYNLSCKLEQALCPEMMAVAFQFLNLGGQYWDASQLC